MGATVNVDVTTSFCSKVLSTKTTNWNSKFL